MIACKQLHPGISRYFYISAGIIWTNCYLLISTHIYLYLFSTPCHHACWSACSTHWDIYICKDQQSYFISYTYRLMGWFVYSSVKVSIFAYLWDLSRIDILAMDIFVYKRTLIYIYTSDERILIHGTSRQAYIVAWTYVPWIKILSSFISSHI